MPPQVNRKARLLVVDDDPGLLRLLTIRLRAENYEVDAVESAAAALAALARVRPDLVITDLRMGMEPRYTFNFEVAQRQSPTFAPLVPPTRYAQRPDAENGLPWLWRRALGEKLPPPR